MTSSKPWRYYEAFINLLENDGLGCSKKLKMCDTFCDRTERKRGDLGGFRGKIEVSKNAKTLLNSRIFAFLAEKKRLSILLYIVVKLCSIYTIYSVFTCFVTVL